MASRILTLFGEEEVVMPAEGNRPGLKGDSGGASNMAFPAGRYDKQYYSIGEVAAIFDVRTSLIRYWTTEFRLKVRTTQKGDRLYTPAIIEDLRTIYHLLKERGYTIAGAKAKLKERGKPSVDHGHLKEALLALRNQLLLIRNELL